MVYTPGTHQGHNLHLLAAGCLLEILLKHTGNFPKELQPTCVFYGLHFGILASETRVGAGQGRGEGWQLGVAES